MLALVDEFAIGPDIDQQRPRRLGEQICGDHCGDSVSTDKARDLRQRLHRNVKFCEAQRC